MGRPKEVLALPNGRSLIETVVDVMYSVCTRVVIAGSTTALPGIEHISDLRLDQGPLGGLEALLASGADAQYLLCPCDLPLVSAELLALLTAEPQAKVGALLVEGETSPRSLPLRIDADALTDVRHLLDEGRRAVHGLFDRMDIDIVDVPKRWADQLINVNTPEDYSEIARRLSDQSPT